MVKWIPMLVVALCIAAPAAGDVVRLKNGGSVEGDVTKTQDGVVVKLPAGEMSFRNDQIDRIEEGPAAISEYQKRAAALKEDDAEGHYKLGLWAKTVGLDRQATEEFGKAVALKPDFADARIALGQRLVNGQWMTEEQQMQARGLVKFEGQWMTPEAVAKLQTLRAELEIARQKTAAAQAELQKAQAQLPTPQQTMPSATYGNPYDSYYSNRYFLGSRTYYWSPYSSFILPGYVPSYRYRVYYPGGYRSIAPRSGHRHR